PKLADYARALLGDHFYCYATRHPDPWLSAPRCGGLAPMSFPFFRRAVPYFHPFLSDTKCCLSHLLRVPLQKPILLSVSCRRQRCGVFISSSSRLLIHTCRCPKPSPSRRHTLLWE